MNTENQDRSREERLWEYIDGLSSAEEKTIVGKLIEADAEWRSLYDELLATHRFVKDSELEEPSMRFTRNIMESIARLQIAPAAKTYINKRIIWGIAAFFITIIASFIIYSIVQVSGSADAGTGSGIKVQIPDMNFGRLFNNNVVNIFLGLNLVLGLFLLDRYLANQRRQRRKEA